MSRKFNTRPSFSLCNGMRLLIRSVSGGKWRFVRQTCRSNERPMNTLQNGGPGPPCFWHNR